VGVNPVGVPLVPLEEAKPPELGLILLQQARFSTTHVLLLLLFLA